MYARSAREKQPLFIIYGVRTTYVYILNVLTKLADSPGFHLPYLNNMFDENSLCTLEYGDLESSAEFKKLLTNYATDDQLREGITQLHNTLIKVHIDIRRVEHIGVAE